MRPHGRNGPLVLDEPAENVESVDVALLDDQDKLSVADWAGLEVAIEESAKQFDRGEFEDARAFAVRLLARP